MPIITTTQGDFAFLPQQARSPMRETLSWYTDVFVSRSGVEQRHAVRNTPRQSFDMLYPVKVGRVAKTLSVTYGSRASNWLVPLWNEAQPIASVDNAATVISADTTNSTYVADGFALMWASDHVYAVVEIESVDAVSITLKSAPGVDLTTPHIMPMRVGRLNGDPVHRTRAGDALYELSFLIDENYDLTPDVVTQYLTYDLHTESIDGGPEGSSETFLHNVEIHDNDSGVMAHNVIWENPKPTRMYRVITETPAQALSFKKWLHRRAGRLTPFWQPSFENDFVVMSVGTVTDTLTVRNDDQREFAPNRNYIAVEHSGGWSVAQITSEVEDVDTIDLTISPSLNVEASDIIRVCYLGLKRLDTDRIEIEWGAGIGTAQISVSEITT